jgi:hypothetical protein
MSLEAIETSNHVWLERSQSNDIHEHPESMGKYESLRLQSENLQSNDITSVVHRQLLLNKSSIGHIWNSVSSTPQSSLHNWRRFSNESHVQSCAVWAQVFAKEPTWICSSRTFAWVPHLLDCLSIQVLLAEQSSRHSEWSWNYDVTRVGPLKLLHSQNNACLSLSSSKKFLFHTRKRRGDIRGSSLYAVLFVHVESHGVHQDTIDTVIWSESKKKGIHTLPNFHQVEKSSDLIIFVKEP